MPVLATSWLRFREQPGLLKTVPADLIFCCQKPVGAWQTGAGRVRRSHIHVAQMEDVAMAVRDLIPWSRGRSSVPSTMQQNDEFSPFLTLHREMNRLFDDVFNRFDSALPSIFGRTDAWPSVEVVETDKDVRVTAELPGLEEKDIEILVNDDVLT